MESLNELQLSQSPVVSDTKEKITVPASDNKLSYEAQKEQNKKIRKFEKQIEDCEVRIEKLEQQIAELELQLATPEGADMQLYEQYQQLKKQESDAEDEWENLSIELDNFKQNL